MALRNSSIPVPFSADKMIYTSTAEVALETDAAYTYSLCVGSDYTANEKAAQRTAFLNSPLE